MAYRPVRKAGLLIPTGTYNAPDALHLHFILTDRCSHGMHLLGSVASIRRGKFHDPTVIIEPGDHPFITQRSYVIYRRFLVQKAAHLTTCVDGMVYQKHDPISEDLWERICDGIEDSEFTPGFVLDYWDENQT